jgi:hypothetical protein
MLGEDSPALFVTFLLAMLGYAGLTATTVAGLYRPLPRTFWRATALVIVVHVGMVWSVRYGFDPALAVRNGWGGFLLFHGALAMILASTVTAERMANVLVRLSFLVVSAGALGAVSLYEVVAIYRLPVALCAVVGGLALGHRLLVSRSRRAPAT